MDLVTGIVGLVGLSIVCFTVICIAFIAKGGLKK